MTQAQELSGMPFRDFPLPGRAHRWLLPGYIALCTLAIAIWVVWIVVLLSGPQPIPKPGQGGVSATAALFIAGIAGLGVITVLGIAVAILLFETTGYDNRLFIARLLTQTVHLAPLPPEPPGPAPNEEEMT